MWGGVHGQERGRSACALTAAAAPLPAAGIATYIFSTQLKDFLGLGVPGHLPPDVPVPAEFLEKVLRAWRRRGRCAGADLQLPL